MTMELRAVGNTGLRASVLGFGCAPVASRATNAESERALRMALERGITFFDTADMYGVGGSERVLGRVLRGWPGGRERAVISTKCGYTFSGKLRAVAWVKPLLRPLVRRFKAVKSSAAAMMTSQRGQSFAPEYIEACLHASLARLGTDSVDVFFLHDPPGSIAARGDVFEKLAALKRAGKLRAYGVSSEASVAEAVLRTAGTGVSVVHVNAGLMEQGAIARVLPLARAGGVGLIARQPFANGRVFTSPVVKELLAAHGLPSDAEYVCGLALRYLRDMEGVSSILPSMMQPRHIEANVAAIAGPAMSAPERAFAAELGARMTASGAEGAAA
jgi:aryl-alcohol dehydrogenase-like predicted oxidoreductase